MAPLAGREGWRRCRRGSKGASRSSDVTPVTGAGARKRGPDSVQLCRTARRFAACGGGRSVKLPDFMGSQMPPASNVKKRDAGQTVPVDVNFSRSAPGPRGLTARHAGKGCRGVPGCGRADQNGKPSASGVKTGGPHPERGESPQRHAADGLKTPWSGPETTLAAPCDADRAETPTHGTEGFSKLAGGPSFAAPPVGTEVHPTDHALGEAPGTCYGRQQLSTKEAGAIFSLRPGGASSSPRARRGEHELPPQAFFRGDLALNPLAAKTGGSAKRGRCTNSDWRSAGAAAGRTPVPDITGETLDDVLRLNAKASDPWGGPAPPGVGPSFYNRHNSAGPPLNGEL